MVFTVSDDIFFSFLFSPERTLVPVFIPQAKEDLWAVVLCMLLLLLVYKALIVVGRSEWTAGLETLAPKVFQRTENENRTLSLVTHRAIKGW